MPVVADSLTWVWLPNPSHGRANGILARIGIDGSNWPASEKTALFLPVIVSPAACDRMGTRDRGLLGIGTWGLDQVVVERSHLPPPGRRRRTAGRTYNSSGVPGCLLVMARMPTCCTYEPVAPSWPSHCGIQGYSRTAWLTPTGLPRQTRNGERLHEALPLQAWWSSLKLVSFLTDPVVACCWRTLDNGPDLGTTPSRRIT